MARCWAYSLGGCDSMSGEHVISNAVFSAGCDCPVVIEGVRRIRDGSPTHNAEKSNILCRRHNSMLSPLDSSIGRVAKFQAASQDPAFNDRLYLDGHLLERWLFKSVVNLAAAGWLGQDKLKPAPGLVAAVFGRADFPLGAGLYTVDGIDPGHSASGGVTVMPMFRMLPEGPSLAGAYVSVHGMGLLACLDDSLAAEIDAGLVPAAYGRFAPGSPRHLYRPGAVVIGRLEGPPLIVAMAWEGLFRFADGTTATLAQVDESNRIRSRSDELSSARS